MILVPQPVREEINFVVFEVLIHVICLFNKVRGSEGEYWSADYRTCRLWTMGPYQGRLWCPLLHSSRYIVDQGIAIIARNVGMRIV